MILPTKLLFELPVYRIDKESYYGKFAEYQAERRTEHYEPSIHDFGGIWEYNEIIGYLKFYVSGTTQIRCEYHETNAKNKVKTRTKTFVLKNDSLCNTNISSAMSNVQLINVIEDCIEHCKGQLNSSRYIDTKFIDETIKHTDWVNVIA